MTKTGLVLGKFMPFHKGHQYLIDTAVEACDKVYVLVCSLESEPIPGHLRYNWVDEHYAANEKVTVVHMTDDMPQEPKDHWDFWNIWRNGIEFYIGANVLTHVFGSEEYVKPLAETLSVNRFNVEPVIVDIARSTVPISGTEIRKNPWGNWKYIPMNVRPYFVHRVAVVGPESTGKSTMCKALAKHFNGYHIEEYGRTHVEDKLARGLEGRTEELCTYEDIKIIGAQQYVNEMMAVQRIIEDESDKPKILFCDTDLTVTRMFSNIYIGKNPLWLDQMIKEGDYLCHLLMDIDIAWVDDGQRDLGHLRAVIFENFKSLLSELELDYSIVSGDGQTRVDNAVAAIESRIPEYFKAFMVAG